jgi:hypothetical protein
MTLIVLFRALYANKLVLKHQFCVFASSAKFHRGLADRLISVLDLFRCSVCAQPLLGDSFWCIARRPDEDLCVILSVSCDLRWWTTIHFWATWFVWTMITLWALWAAQRPHSDIFLTCSVDRAKASNWKLLLWWTAQILLLIFWLGLYWYTTQGPGALIYQISKPCFKP